MKLNFPKIFVISCLLLTAVIPAVSLRAITLDEMMANNAANAGTRKFCYTVTINDNTILGGTDTGQPKLPICFDTNERCVAARKDAANSWARSFANFIPGTQNLVDTRFVSNCFISEGGASNPLVAPQMEHVGNPGACNLTDFNPLACLKIIVAWGISSVLWLLGWILWLAAQIFNISLHLSILDFSGLANSKAVSYIWGLGRDLANVFFIFILIYIAIATIIQKAGIQTKSMVVKLIITALLINFSIIIPKVIIDVGNSLANVFYRNMAPAGETTGTPDIASILVKGAKPQNFFKTELGNQSALNADGTPKANTGSVSDVLALDWSVILLKGLGAGILIIILAYALLIAAYMFLARTVVLTFLIATSSLAFFSRIIPSELNLNYWNSWFSALIKEVVFAPYFLFVFYLVLKLANEPIPGINAPATATGGAVAQASSGVNIAMQVAWYLVLCGLAIGSVIIAKKASSWSQQVVSKVGKYGGSFVASHTVGRAAKAVSESTAMKATVRTSPRLGGWAQDKVKGLAGFGFGSKAGGFTTRQKEDVATFKRRIEGMNDKDKSKTLANMSAWRMAPGGQSIYEQLDDKTRAKMEKKVGKDEGYAARYAQMRGKLGGKEPWKEKDTNVERLKDLKGEQRLKAFLDLDYDAREDIWGDLGAGVQTQMSKDLNNNNLMDKVLDLYPKNQPITIKDKDGKEYSGKGVVAPIRTEINSFVEKMSVEDQSKFNEIVEKAEKGEKARQETENRRTIIDTIHTEMATGGTSPTLITETPKLSKGDIGNLNEKAINWLAIQPTQLNKMKAEALVALLKHNKLTDQNALMGKLNDIDKGQVAGLTPSNTITAINKNPINIIL